MTEHPFHKDDIADSARAIRESIAAKQATRPRVDANGYTIGTAVDYEYDEFGRMVGKAEPPKPPA